MKKKLTLIDILIIIAVVLVMAFLLTKIVSGRNGNQKTVSFAVMATNLLPENADAVKVCDRVLVDAEDDIYGKIVSVESKASEDYYFDYTKESYLKNVVEERKDVFLNVEVDVDDTEAGYKAGERFLRIGEAMYLAGDDFVVQGFVIGFEEK